MSVAKQAHDGAVSINTPAVVYGYEDGASGGEAGYVRLDKVVYPDGREVYYNYPSSGVGAVLSRLDNIAADASGTTQYARCCRRAMVLVGGRGERERLMTPFLLSPFSSVCNDDP